MKQGFYDNIPMGQYHEGPELSSSGLKELALSEAHYAASRANRPQRNEIIGTLTHMRVLEPHLFASKVEAIEGHRGGKEVKQAVADAVARGKIVCKPEEYEKVIQMGAAIMLHPHAKKLFVGGVAERSFYWTDQDTGAPCRCRSDYFIEKKMIVADIKYFSNLSDFELQRQVRGMKYDWSAAFYEDGIRAVTGASVEVFAHVFVEEPRFPGDHVGVRVITLDDMDLDKAREQYRPLVEKFAKAHKTGIWPSYPEEITALSTLQRY